MVGRDLLSSVGSGVRERGHRTRALIVAFVNRLQEKNHGAVTRDPAAPSSTARRASPRYWTATLRAADDLEVRDQLAHGGARVARVAPQLALELQAAPVAHRARAQLEVCALHLGAAIEEPVDLGEREQADAAVRKVVGDGEQAREEPRVVATDLLRRGARRCARS